MISKPRASVHLDRLLEILEEQILKASDREMLNSKSSSPRAVDEVRKLIDQHLKPNSSPLPSEASARLALLQSLLRAQHPASQNLRMAFTAGRNPTEGEVDKLLLELIRLGALDEPKS